METDLRPEKIGYKIREAQLEKVPYMLIIGEKEQTEGTVAIRSRKNGDKVAMSLEYFIAEALEEIKMRSKD